MLVLSVLSVIVETEIGPLGSTIKGQSCWIYPTLSLSPEGAVIGQVDLSDVELRWLGGGADLGKVKLFFLPIIMWLFSVLYSFFCPATS